MLLVFLIIAAIAGASYYLQYQARQKRMKAVAALGAGIGFAFSADDVEDLRDLPFSLFNLGSRHQLTNVLSGTHNGVPMHLFDYAYYVQSGKSGQWYRFTCGLAAVPAACPRLALGHESFFTRAAEHLGLADVQLESDDFNRRFRVQCGDQRFAFSLLDGAMMEWLVAAGTFHSLEIDGPLILVSYERLDPAAWLDIGAWLDQFHSHIPEVVYSTYPPQ